MRTVPLVGATSTERIVSGILPRPKERCDMRIASYNVENLFTRARALNLDTWKEGKIVLEAYAELNSLLEESVYTDENKARMIELLKRLDPLQPVHAILPAPIRINSPPWHSGLASGLSTCHQWNDSELPTIVIPAVVLFRRVGVFAELRIECMPPCF